VCEGWGLLSHQRFEAEACACVPEAAEAVAAGCCKERPIPVAVRITLDWSASGTYCAWCVLVMALNSIVV
jgi:hypothetical protein